MGASFIGFEQNYEEKLKKFYNSHLFQGSDNTLLRKRLGNTKNDLESLEIDINHDFAQV